jgi:ribosomal protein S18 acetylase RimI-like enzyme
VHITVRESNPEDEDRIVEIALRAWEPIDQSFRRMLGADLFAILHPDWRREKERQIRSAFADDHGAFAVAELDGRVVGFVSFYAKRSGVGEIGHNAVDPAFQSRGIATRLYAHALDRLRDAGMTHAEVRTGLDPAHGPARRAYRKAGFDRERPTVTYYRQL